MGLRSLFSRSAYRGMASWVRSQRARLTEPDPLFELPELLEKPDGTRVMVVAPHADDETLGCGGTLVKHHLAGDRVTVVFMTDGGKGEELAGGVRGRALVGLREREAQAAAAALGVDECIFLRNPDGSLRCTARTVEQLDGVLDTLRPDIIYAPSPLDTHRDHRQACAILAAALGKAVRAVEVYVYEVWAPIPANCAVGIDLERKVRAIRLYRSQMDERELYVAAATTLARYRGISCLPGQDVPVECFLRLNRSNFVEFVKGVT